MTNRDYILKTCPYDIIVNLNKSIIYDDYKCIIETLKDTRIYIRETDGERARCINSLERKHFKNCEQCIQRWLNEERNHI